MGAQLRFKLVPVFTVALEPGLARDSAGHPAELPGGGAWSRF